MKAVLAIAAREVAERKLVLAAGGVLALLIPLTPLLPGVTGFSASDIVTTSALWVALFILGAGSLVMGVTSINQDLAERRIGFYFSRPVSGLTIWAGKVAGALAVVLATAAITFLPAVVSGFEPIVTATPEQVATVVWGVAGLFFLGNVAACAARARSAWLLLDVVGLFVVAAATVALVRLWAWTLPFDDFEDWVRGSVISGARAAILIAAFAGLLGLLRGRVDAQRVHRWTSVSLWTMVAAGLVAATTFSVWVSGSTPADIPLEKRRAYMEGGNGDWIVLYGPARGGMTQAFLARDDGAFLPLGSSMSFSIGDERIVSFRPPVVRRFVPYLQGTVYVAELNARPVWRETTITAPVRHIWQLEPVLSSRGTRLAVRTERGFAVYSMPDERFLAQKERWSGLDETWSQWHFVDDDHLRKIGWRPRDRHAGTIQVEDLDLLEGTLHRPVYLPGDAYSGDPGNRFILLSAGAERRIVEVETGVTVGTFESAIQVRTVRWLSDGSIAVPDRLDDGSRVLRILELDGSERLRIEFPDDNALPLGFETRPGLLAVAAWRAVDPERCDENQRLLAVDLATGETRLVAKGLAPVWSRTHMPPGSKGARRFDDCHGRIFRFDENLDRSETILD